MENTISKVFDKDRSYNEFQFAKYIDYCNKMLVGQDADALISTSRARHLHDTFLNYLPNGVDSLSSITEDEFMSALAQVHNHVVDWYGSEYVLHPYSTDEYNRQKAIFTNIINSTKDIENADGIQAAMIPLSPYDHRYRNMSEVMRQGGRILYVKQEDVKYAMDTDPDFTDAYEHIRMHTYTPKGYRPGVYETRAGEYSGLNRLAPFIEKKEFEDVFEWVASNGMHDHSKYMTPKALDRSVAILEYLQENGITYSIEKGQERGQVNVRLSESLVTIRLLESREEEHYVGRVSSGGTKFYYITDAYDTNTKKLLPHSDITIDETIGLLKYALGESQPRSGMNGNVGELSSYKQGYKNLATTYSGDKGDMSALVTTLPNKVKVFLHVKGRATGDHRYLADENAALDYLSSSVAEAYEACESQLNINSIKQSASMYMARQKEIDDERRNARKDAIDSLDVPDMSSLDYENLVDYLSTDDDDTNPDYSDIVSNLKEYEPTYSVYSLIAEKQANLFEYLTKKRLYLLREGVTEDEYLTALANGDDVTSYIYTGSDDEIVNAYATDFLKEYVGDQERLTSGAFNPSTVSEFMPGIVSRNNADLIYAMGLLNIDATMVQGTGYQSANFKNAMIEFDPIEARQISTNGSDFEKLIASEIATTVRETGCMIDDDDIYIDDKGIVAYTAYRKWTRGYNNDKSSLVEFTGTVGQFFEPDARGVVTTNFGSGENYKFSPAYEAYVVPQKVGENKSLEERTRLRGYEQLMVQKLRTTIRNNIISMPKTYDEVGRTTSMNTIYRHLYDIRYDVDYDDKSVLDGLSPDLRDDIMYTNSRRVRYSNELKQDSTINADYSAKKQASSEYLYTRTNDNFSSTYNLTGNRNMSILSKEGSGYFDLVATSTATNQGIVRFLCDSAVVNLDGSITKGEENDEVRLMKHPSMVDRKHSPFDRQQMVFNNLTKAVALTEPTATAHMTFGGWCMDDGYVISRDFAKKHAVTIGGEKRELKVGDKISDLHGNKGVIGLVIDREMSQEDAREQNLEKELKWFTSNPELDVVGSPYTAPSRFNGGSVRELMKNVKPLHNPDTGKVTESIGHARYIITPQFVDKKTILYDEEAMREGRGRKAGAQLAWALASYDAKGVMDEYYESNNRGTQSLREYLIHTGLDLTPTGRMTVGYTPHPDENRILFEMPNLTYLRDGTRLDTRGMSNRFMEDIRVNGGFMEIPFELAYPTPKGDDFVPRMLDVCDKGKGTYKMPILSASMRNAREVDDGTISYYDYTQKYRDIFISTIRYRQAQSKGDTETMEKEKSIAQIKFDAINADIISRRFDGKRNIFKESIMSQRIPNTSTAVWTADPRLDIDQVAISPAIAETLGVKDGEFAIVWRDPIIREKGVQGMRVKIDESLTGMAVNPAVGPLFEGDFDGDALGIGKIHTKAAYKDLLFKMSVLANLVDRGSKDENDMYSLHLQGGMDVQSVLYENEDLKSDHDKLTVLANDLEEESKGSLSVLDERSLIKKRKRLMTLVSNHYHKVLDCAYATDVIEFGSIESHLRSVEHMVTNGAKGSMSKLQDYAMYLGVEFESSDEGIDYNTLVDYGKPLADIGDYNDSQYATAVKSFGTGVAGSFSQRAMAVCRNKCPRAALELTYPVTQAVLQAKKDPVEARHKYDMLMTTARDMWRGYKMSTSTREDGFVVWNVDKTKDGKPVMANMDAWVKQMSDFYSHKDGLNVNVAKEHIETVAYALSEPSGGNRVMVNMEKSDMMKPMDLMAYQPSFKNVYMNSALYQDLFEGKYNSHFAPSSIRRNVARFEKGEDLISISKRDIQTTMRDAQSMDFDLMEPSYVDKLGCDIKTVASKTDQKQVEFDVSESPHPQIS